VMIGAAMGLAARGAIPFPSTFACFLERASDFIRMAGISNLGIKLAGSHAGVSIGEDGPSQMALEDLAMARGVPNCTVLYPCDGVSATRLMAVAASVPGPVYIRFGREDVPVVTDESTPFTFGKGEVFGAGTDVTVIACGVMVYEALRARAALASRNVSVRVINLHTIKPLDREIIVKAARETGAIVTAEEHQVNGGLGGAVAEVLVQELPVPVEMVAVHDRFGQSGKPAELMAAFGLKEKDVIAAIERVLARKGAPAHA